MFDVGFSELCLVGLVSLLVIGPEKLPQVARILGFWLGKARHMVASVKAEINEELLAEEARQLLNEQAALLEQINSKSLRFGQDMQQLQANLSKEIADIGVEKQQAQTHSSPTQPKDLTQAAAIPVQLSKATPAIASDPVKRPKNKKRRHGAK